jgi:SHS2 domain-containing protein
MLQAFCTRLTTDIAIIPFTNSGKGIIHNAAYQMTEQYANTTWPSFKEEDLTKLQVVVFGILRGTGDLIKKCDDLKHTYYHFDHAYCFKEQKHEINPIFNEKIYRITKNGLMINYIDKINHIDKERIQKFKKHINIKPWKKEGDYVLVLPPSEHVKKWYNIPNWEKETVEKLKQHTNREIIIKNKNDQDSYMKMLSNAWAVVTCQSTAAVDVLLEGVPSFCNEMSMAKPVSHTDLSLIETPFYPENREEWIDSLLANQYLMSEIESGFAWNRLREKII